MLRIFIGYDDSERIAYHVLSHSIMRRASIPLSITPLHRGMFAGIYSRTRGPMESTDFSMLRFIVPYLCEYQDSALFMDCDMLCRGDIIELARFLTLATRWTKAAHVVKHDYDPNPADKFLGQKQTIYRCKNWSSVMLLNNHLCRTLTPEFVNSQPGLTLHQFGWTSEDRIGELPKTWNHLVGESGQCAAGDARLIHFTRGGPWFKEYETCEFADEWRAELEHMNGHH